MNKQVYEFNSQLAVGKIAVEQTPYGICIYLDEAIDPIVYIDLHYLSEEGKSLPNAGLVQVVLYSPVDGEDPLAYAMIDKAGRMVIDPEGGAIGSQIYYEEVAREEK